MAVQNYYIALTYKLYVKDEDDEKEAFAEQCDANRPFTFISHLACVLPAFEQKILELAVQTAIQTRGYVRNNNRE